MSADTIVDTSDKDGAKDAEAPPPDTQDVNYRMGEKAPGEFTVRRYHVDLTTRSVRREVVTCTDLEDVVGAAARAFKLLDGVAVDDPYDPAVPLIMNTGILSGTEFMTGLRTYFHAYSPLKNSLAGKPSAMWTAGSGKFGTKLRHLGVDEVIFTGRATEPIYLRITPGPEDQGPYFIFGDGKELYGQRVNAKIQLLHKRFPDAHFAVLGPAGENYTNVRYAAIALSTENQLKSGDMKSRFCGRGGIGGVMGSKNLITIIADTPDVRGKKAPPELKPINSIVAKGEGSRRFRDAKRNNGGGGTWANVEHLHPMAMMPEYNFVPTGDDKLSAGLSRPAVEEKGDFLIKDEACYRCGIRCHKNVYDAEEKDGKVVAGKYRAKLDYEPLNLMSSNLGIFDLGQCTNLVELCDDLGMDSISLGGSLSFAMEYNRRHAEEGQVVADGLAYGDYEATHQAIEDIGRGFLDELGQGSKRLGEAVGEPQYAMHCKGMEFPAYLPQTNPGYPWALAGGHMSMRTYLLYLFEKETGMDYWVDAITQRGTAIMRDDLLGICKFAGTDDKTMVDAIAALTGLSISIQDIRDLIRRTYLRGWKMERQQGFGAGDYVMPAEVHKEYPQIRQAHFNTPEFFEELRGKVCERFDEMLASEGV